MLVYGGAQPGRIHPVIDDAHPASAPFTAHLLGGRARDGNSRIGAPQTHPVHLFHEFRTPGGAVIDGIIPRDSVLGSDERGNGQ